MKLGQEYANGGTTVQLATIEGDLYLNIPDGGAFVPEIDAEDYRRSCITSTESCTSCSMPLQEVRYTSYGHVFSCTKCATPDIWIPLNYGTLASLKDRATALGETVIVQLLNQIQQENNL